MKNRLLLLLLVLSFNCLSVSAQSWLWGQQGLGGLRTGEAIGNVATDKTGNVYETGAYLTSVIFGTDTLISTSMGDVFLVKYDQNGNVLWANTSSSSSNGVAEGLSVATDDSDNSYVTGFAYNTPSTGGDTLVFGADTLYTPAGGGMFLVKYNAAGKLMWATQPGVLVDSVTVGWAVTTDNFGHEYVTGNGAFLIKYDRNGNVIWNAPQVSNNDFPFSTYGYSVATDSYGNIYVTGLFIDSLIFGTYKLYYKGGNGNNGSLGNLFIAKFDSNGNALWAHQSTDSFVSQVYFNNNNGEYSVTANRAGSVYLTSSFANIITLGADTFSTGNKDDSTFTYSFFVVKYNPDGTVAWSEQANASNKSSWGSYSIYSDDSGHIYISGAEAWYSWQTNASFTLGNYTVTINNPDNYGVPSFLLKLDSLGNVLCSSTLADGGEQLNYVTSDPTGKFVYLGGVFVDSFSIGKNYLIDMSGSFDSYIARWQSCLECDLTALSSPPSSTICAGQSVTLTASGGTTYTWSPSTGLSATTGSTVVADPLTNVTYMVSVTDSVGCSAKALDSVIVNFPPDTPVITQHKDALISSAKQGNQWVRNDTVLQGATNQTYIIIINGEYKVVTQNPANGCSSTSDSGYYTTTGINQLTVESGQLTVYPNPTGGEIMVTISSSAMDVKDWNLQVTDVLGRRVYFKQSLNYSNDIDLASLSSGVYFICVMNKTGRVVVPVVKE